MARSRADSTSRTLAQIEDSQDLRSVISKALAASPIDEASLRRAVWTYVGAEHDSGTSPGLVIMALTTLIETVPGVASAERQQLLRRVILWSVEAYFGHLGGVAVGHDGRALPDS